MAKDDLGGIKLRTTQPRTERTPKGEGDKIKPRGVGLKAAEWDRFDKIARELGMKPHALSLWVVRDFMRRYDAGEVETVTGKKLAG